MSDLKHSVDGLETLNIYGVKLDIYYNYRQYDGEYELEIISIEDITGTQDLQELLGEAILDKITQEISSIEQGRL